MSELASIQQLWKEHESRSFPRALAGEDFDGEDLVLIDSSAAGCISTFLDGGGAHSLDAKRLQMLGECVRKLSRICPQLPSEHQLYFDSLKELAERVINYSRRDLR
jgi:hypothetical protein